MNKKLLAVAVAGVLAAPLAQAQTANVTLYGRLNLDAEVIINAKQDNTSGIPGTGTPAAGTKQNIYRVSSNSSRLGVKRHRVAGWRSQRDLPDRIVDQRRRERRHAGRPRNLRRPAGRLGYVEDGLLPRALRRHPRGLR